MTEDDVIAALVDIIADDTWPLLDLLDRIEERFGSELDLGLVEAILDDDPAFVIVEEHPENGDPTGGEPTELVFHLPSRAEGLRLGLVIDDARTDGSIELHPWLSPVAGWLIDGQLPVLVGDQVVECWTEERVVDDAIVDVLVVPDGGLDELAGRSVTATVTDGNLRLDAVDDPLGVDAIGADAVLLGALATGFQRTARAVTAESPLTDGPVDLRLGWPADPFLHALATDRATLVGRPLPPIPDLYRAAGLEIQGIDVAQAGFDWDLLASWRRRNQTMLQHGLDGDDADGTAMVVGAALSVMADGVEALGADENERDGAAILMVGLLERPAVAAAVWRDLDVRGRIRELGPFLSEIEDRLEGVDIVGPGWLRARILEDEGRSAEAAELLSAVVGPDCRHTPALLDLAGYAADRSALAEATELIRRSGAEADAPTRPIGRLDDHQERLVDEVAAYRRVDASRHVGRNQPCPCGSGRKFKACHLRTGWVTFDDRAGWLNDKMVRYAIQHGDEVLAEVAGALAGDDPMLALDLESSPLTIDLALWEGKVADGFVASRQPLLPADEAALLDGWAAARRTILRVAEIDGERVTFDDLVRGGQQVLDNIESGGGLRRPMMFLARPVPVGEVNRILAPLMPLDEAAVDGLTPAVESGGVTELARALARFGPRSSRANR